MRHIDVKKNGELLIKEDITVLAKGKRIKRGIYREFPMRYKRNGINYSIDFDLVKVLRDGREENYFTKRTDSSVRIYIGKKEIFLKEGVYEYTLSYTGM